jgi:ribosome-dependent ATPase
MNEGERCDRISLMHAGRVLVSDPPAEIVRARGAASLQEAFISHLEEAAGQIDEAPPPEAHPAARGHAPRRAFSPGRLLAYARREQLELLRDPIRLAFALAGALFLMLIFGYGLNMDVEDVRFAVLDQDGSRESRDYARAYQGSHYFVSAPHRRRRRAGAAHARGELSVAIGSRPTSAGPARGPLVRWAWRATGDAVPRRDDPRLLLRRAPRPPADLARREGVAIPTSPSSSSATATTRAS